MDGIVCPKCRAPADIGDNFCRVCGINLRAAREPITVMGQVMLYIGSLLLPPLGIFWGLGYIAKPDTKSKTAGFIAIALTVLSVVLTARWTMGVIDSVTTQVNALKGAGF